MVDSLRFDLSDQVARHAQGKTEMRIIVVIFAAPSMQVEAARREIGPVDDKIETRDFANVRKIGVGLVGEDRHRATSESEFAIIELWVFPEKRSDCECRPCLLEIAPIAQLGRGHFVLLQAGGELGRVTVRARFLRG